MKSTQPITVLLAEDHTIVREGLRKLLETGHEIAVVGEAETGRQAVELARKLRPAVVVMDISMPLLNGLEATRQILKAHPAMKVIILSAHNDAAYIEQAMAFGAVGFLLKHTSANILFQAIRDVHKGGTSFCPSVARELHDHYHKSPDRLKLLRNKGSLLSPREVEVLQLIAEGKANKQVATELGISVKTVEKHRQRCMGKLNIHDTAGLTRYALSAGIIKSGVQLAII